MTSADQPSAPMAKRPTARVFRFGYLAHDVSRIRRTVMDQALRPMGITRSQWTVLSSLSRGGNDGMMQVDLARLLEVGKVTVGGLVDRLEATGYVERRSDASDRRVKRVFITAQGYKVIEEMIDVAATLNARITRGIGSEQMRACENVLLKVKQNLKAVLIETSQHGSGDEKSPAGGDEVDDVTMVFATE